MSRARYRKGDRIASIHALVAELEAEHCVVRSAGGRDQVQNPGFLQNWSLHVLTQGVHGGHFHYAVPIEENQPKEEKRP